MTIDQIRQKAYFLTSTSGTDDFPDEVLIGEANNALERVGTIIIQSDGRWQWDDYNNSNLPIARTQLNEDQQDYQLEVDYLEVLRMEVIDTDGNPHKLQPIDMVDVHDTSLAGYLNTSGLPMFYDKYGSSVYLYPKPNYTQALSLVIYFQRLPSYFVIADTDKSPGFNGMYHDLIPLWIAYNFALANGKSNAQALMKEITMREDALREDYALRSKDDPIGLRARPSSWR